MADYSMDSDSLVCSKRKITTDTEQQEETLLQLQLPSSFSETTVDRRDSTPEDGQEVTAMDHSSPKKKSKCFSLPSEANQETGLHSFTQKNVPLSGSFEKEKIDDVDNKEGSSFGVQEVYSKEHLGTGLESGEKRAIIIGEAFEKEKMDDVENKEGSFGVQEVDSQVNAIEADKKERLGTGLEFGEKSGDIKGEAKESERVLEAEKKRLLSELEVGNIFGLAANSSKIDDKISVGGTKGLDLAVKGSLKIEVIDDTALIGSFPLARTGNGSRKTEKKKGAHEIDCTKTKRSRRKGKNVKKALGESGTVGLIESTEFSEVQNGCKTECNTQNKIMYSRKDLEALRFAKVVEQRNFWKDVYNSLGKDVIREYEDLGSWKHQKNISSGPRHRFGRKAEAPANMREDNSENVGNELEYMEDNETENVYPFGFTPTTHDVQVQDAFVDVEEECIEDDDSDEDYTTILRPAFMVQGEPNFDSGPPEDGLEYLRRVRWEAARIPKVNIAKPDKIISSKEQSVYMPQIPDIAKCPDHLLPLKQWEESFLKDFSELRLTLSLMEDPSAEISCKLPSLSVQEDEVRSDSSEISLSHNHPCPKTSINDTCVDYPTLSAIRKMDYVARVSMLRKRISLVENMSSLSRSNGVWLFALCAAIDTPLDADTCASLRCLLRKCAELRAVKSEVDDEVIMLNILATISGRYFGQSET